MGASVAIGDCYYETDPHANKQDAIDEQRGCLLAIKEQIEKYLEKEQVAPVLWNDASEDLEQAIDTYLATYWGGEKEKQEWPFLKKMAIHFAAWQKEQLENNRLKHCDSITNEQAELEQGFIDQHLDKYQRMPTFLDAIEYGMRLQKEQMMKDSVLCGVDGWFINNKRNCRKNGRFYKYYESTITHDKPLPMENGKDYRLITIKED